MPIDMLGPDEGGRLRALRLRALRDAPDAFASTLEEAEARPAESWQRQLQLLPTFVAVIDNRDVGIVRCAPHEDRADTVWLISMWVAPEARGHGVGGSLVNAVVAWARAQGLSRILLDVGDHSESAIALYERKGFVRTGESSCLPPPREHITEHRRELRL